MDNVTQLLLASGLQRSLKTLSFSLKLIQVLQFETMKYFFTLEIPLLRGG